jgi:TPR repeat protein
MDIFTQRINLTFLLLCLSFSSSAADVFKADSLFKAGNFEKAKQEYAQAAQVGSPHAFYQLGNIYNKGLSVSQDNVSAFIWFSLAAEYKFGDANQAASDIYKLLSSAQQIRANDLLPVVKESFGKQQVDIKYYPVLKQENLNEKITFGGEGKLAVNYQDPDLVVDESNSFDDNGFDVNDSYTGDESGAFEFSAGNQLTPMMPGDDLRYSIQLRPAFKFKRRTPFLIVDYDVGPDGSVRNVTPVQKIGYSRPLEEKFVMNNFPAPNFKDTRVSFLNRSYIGSAAYARNKMDDKNEVLFDKVRRLAKKLKASNLQEDKYEYAMMLLTFKWLKQQDGEAQILLKEVAQMGHPRAQYELGAKLYREQTNVEEGIYWISEASKYGLSKAEYLLANILRTSPWVVNDEKKALFWYESAIEKDHLAAKLKASELKMLAIDTSLHDFDSATQYLTSMQEKQSNNPEFYFLMAVAEKNLPDRNFSKVIRYVERAIGLGKKLNWDVSYWQGLINKWTTGKVYIVED